MQPDALQLETLRQKIEDVLYESANQSDYLDRGKPNPSQAKKAQKLMTELNDQGRQLQAELKQQIASTRSKNPQAIDEWVDYHVGILQKILDEKTTAVLTPRKVVAKETNQNWEKVRAGEIDYVNINWHYLKDYKESVGTMGRTSTSDGNAWWQFWK
jgi:hypothetical protein